MKILHLSDTHNLHRELIDLPKADLIIHSGDISFSGEGNEVMDFIDWFYKLDYNYKIFIAGNHDFCLEGKDRDIIQELLPKNCYYLDKSGVRIEDIQFWGLPFFFSDDISGMYDKSIKQIPFNTD
ncbi:MAG: metallophosphoesterase, partial [Bacteroidales bacterium]|nr:metallophosphoesterase [Bacteroidales bacterium]